MDSETLIATERVVEVRDGDPDQRHASLLEHRHRRTEQVARCPQYRFCARGRLQQRV